MATYWRVLIMALVMAGLPFAAHGYTRQDTCPLQTNSGSGDMSFARPPTTSPSACENSQRDLACCVQNYDILVWMVYDNVTDKWTELKETSQMYFLEQNQVLVIEQARSEYDGEYRCVATDEKGKAIHADIRFTVRDNCGASDYPPKIILPPEDDVRITPLGSSPNITCKAYYGPDWGNDPFGSFLLWHHAYFDDNGTEVETTPSAVLSEFPEHMESVITINNMTTTDYGNYTCLAHNSMGTTVRLIKLVEGDPDALPIEERNVDDPVNPVLARALGCTFAALLVVICTIYVKRQTIHLRLKDRFGTPKHPDKLFDAFVVHNEDSSRDRDFILYTLLPKLETELGYKIAISERDYIPGEAIATNLAYFLKNSQCIVFLVTEDMVTNEWCDLAFQMVVAQHYTNLVFITRGHIRDEIWHKDQAPFRDVMHTSKNVIPWGEPKQIHSRLLPKRYKDDSQFWDRLRLALPARLKTPAVHACGLNQIEKQAIIA